MSVSCRRLEKCLPRDRPCRRDGRRPRCATLSSATRTRSEQSLDVDRRMPTSSNAILFCTSKAMRESRYRTSFSKTKFFFDCDEILAFSSRRTFCAAGLSVCRSHNMTIRSERTASEVVLDFQFPLIRIHREVERRHRVALGCTRRPRAIVR